MSTIRIKPLGVYGDRLAAGSPNPASDAGVLEQAWQDYLLDTTIDTIVMEAKNAAGDVTPWLINTDYPSNDSKVHLLPTEFPQAVTQFDVPIGRTLKIVGEILPGFDSDGFKNQTKVIGTTFICGSDFSQSTEYPYAVSPEHASYLIKDIAFEEFPAFAITSYCYDSLRIIGCKFSKCRVIRLEYHLFGGYAPSMCGCIWATAFTHRMFGDVFAAGTTFWPNMRGALTRDASLVDTDMDIVLEEQTYADEFVLKDCLILARGNLKQAEGVYGFNNYHIVRIGAWDSHIVIKNNDIRNITGAVSMFIDTPIVLRERQITSAARPISVINNNFQAESDAEYAALGGAHSMFWIAGYNPVGLCPPVYVENNTFDLVTGAHWENLYQAGLLLMSCDNVSVKCNTFKCGEVEMVGNEYETVFPLNAHAIRLIALDFDFMAEGLAGFRGVPNSELQAAWEGDQYIKRYTDGGVSERFDIRENKIIGSPLVGMEIGTDPDLFNEPAYITYKGHVKHNDFSDYIDYSTVDPSFLQDQIVLQSLTDNVKVHGRQFDNLYDVVNSLGTTNNQIKLAKKYKEKNFKKSIEPSCQNKMGKRHICGHE